MEISGPHETDVYKRQEYTLPGVSQTVILSRLEGRTPVPEKEKILSLAKHHATMIIFLSVGKIEVLVQLMSESYEKDTCLLYTS